MNHYVNQCVHGVVISQCRCPSPSKTVRIVDCPVSCAVPSQITLDFNAQIEADMAFLHVQANGGTQAECVEAALIAYLERVQ